MCPDCREKTVTLVQRNYTLTSEYDGATYEVTLHEVGIPTCSRCGEGIITSDISQRITAELRRAAGLLSPEEIRAKREALGMTQTQLASALRVGDLAIQRWEAGMQLQSRAMDLLLRLYFESAEVRQACISAPSSPLASPPISSVT